MKKILFFMTNENGFYLPYVLFVVAIVFIILTANINIYSQEIKLTENHIDQLKIETLMQMGRVEFKRQLMEDSDNFGAVQYNFPDGNVEIVYEQISDEEYLLLFRIHLKEGSIYKMTSYLWMN